MLFFRREPSEVSKNERMKFIALKTKKTAAPKEILPFSAGSPCQQTGYYQYLVMKDRPWKYQPLADAMKDILAEDI